jgi:hypothetical protein
MRLVEGHVMSDTAMVPRNSEGRPPGRRPLVDDELADRLLGQAQAEGVELRPGSNPTIPTKHAGHPGLPVRQRVPELHGQCDSLLRHGQAR